MEVLLVGPKLALGSWTILGAVLGMALLLNKQVVSDCGQGLHACTTSCDPSGKEETAQRYPCTSYIKAQLL